jgi:hypothetical protein
VNPFRGVLMIVAAAIAFWRGWQIHTGRYALMAYGLAVVALAVAGWHFIGTDRRRSR